MLFHSLLAPGSGIYFIQVCCRLRNLDVSVFAQVWQQLIDRHSILRSAFVWKNVEKPLQVVGRQVGLALEQQDWRGLSASEQAARFAAHLETDRKTGFNLMKAPVMRLALFQTGERDYKFLWSFHHILIDGWSTSLLLSDFLNLYRAVSGSENHPSARRRSFRDYIGWLQQQDLGKAEEFWRGRLKGFAEPTRLGIERKSIAGALEPPQSDNFAEQYLHLSESITAGLQRVGREQQVTLNTVVQGAWALLLSRYSGSEEVVFGATVSGRPASLAGVEEMVGLFINTLPVRVEVKSEAQVGGYLRRLQEQQVEVRQYEYSPLVEVQGWSEVGRGMPLFDTIVVFENYPVSAIVKESNGGLSVSDARSIDQSNYPLTLIGKPGTTLQLNLLYDSERYERASMVRMLEHLETLLEGIALKPEQPLGTLSLLSAAAREQILVAWNQTTADYPLSSCIHHLFEEQVRRTPDAVAARSTAASLTYAELDARANQLAHFLLDSGIRREAVVALLLDHSCETLVAILGVLKAGCAYLPLDPWHPPARMAFTLADAQAALLISTHSLSERLGTGIAAHLPTPMPPVLALDRDWQRCAALPATAPAVPSLSSSSAAYVIYTSGSTGVPKGVVIEHASLVNYICWAQSVYLREGAPGDCPLSSSLAFDLTVTSLFLPLVSGHTLHLYPQQDATPALLEVMEDHRCQVLKLTPSHLALIRDLDNRQSHIRCLIVGGEALSTELAQTVSESFGHQVEIYNEYGPTEATVGCMIYRFKAGAEERAWVLIGRPAANTQIYILDERLEPTAEHVTGELYIGGAGVARGYLGRAELTAERFVPDPFSGRAGGRLYCTGDRARLLADGTVEYLGRNDEQVKYHGYRVELNELRLALSAHAKVRDAVVVLRKDGPGGREQLVGYYVGREAIAVEELREHMQERVIAETVPQWFVHLRRLPLTLNGKVNVEALPAPWVEERGGIEYVAPRTDAEQLLRNIWHEVLGIEKIGIHDNFFDLGGQSILLVKVHHKIREAFQHELTLVELFKYPTIYLLAEQLKREPEAAVESHLFQRSFDRAETRRELVDRQRAARRSVAAERTTF